MTTRISLGLAQQVCYILEHENKWISVLIYIFHHVSSCFITWNDDGEKNGACALCRAACAEHKWHMIGSAESKRSSSTFLGKRQSYDFMGGWRVYNIWVQKDLHQSLYM